MIFLQLNKREAVIYMFRPLSTPLLGSLPAIYALRMSETPQVSRKQIDAELPDRLVDSLRDLIGAQRSRQLFRDRLVHVLTRYEVYKAATKTATRNEYRKQLSNLQEKAQGFLVAIRALHPEVRQTLNGHLDTMTWESRFEGFDLLDEKSVWPDDDSGFELAEGCRWLDGAGKQSSKTLYKKTYPKK